jgi:hypothetical protein
MPVKRITLFLRLVDGMPGYELHNEMIYHYYK